MSNDEFTDLLHHNPAGYARLKSVGIAAVVVIAEHSSGAVMPSEDAALHADRLPFVALRTRIPLANYVLAVSMKLLERQTAALVGIQRVHDVFTALGAAGSGPNDILAAAHRLIGAAVGYESSDHTLLDFCGAAGADLDFAADWESRSRSVPPTTRAFWDERAGWLVCPIGPPQARKGRVVFSSQTAPAAAEIAAVERTAAALAAAFGRVTGPGMPLRQQHKLAIEELSANPSNPDACRRAWLAGIPTEHRRYVGMILRPVESSARAVEGPGAQPGLDSECLRAARRLGVECLAALFDREARVILALPVTADEVALADAFAAIVRGKTSLAIAAGAAVNNLKSVDRSLREAKDVFAIVPPGGGTQAVYRLTNTRIRGLLALLSGDTRLRDFVTRELEALIQESAKCHIDLVDTARVLVENWHSKSLAARELHISRPVLYDRIRRIEQVLGEDLDSCELRTSLHVALLSRSLATAQ